jgi:hypothetical protein
MMGSQLGQHVCGAEGSGGRFVAFVSRTPTRSLDGLLHGINGKDPETYRQTIAHRYISQALRGFTRDVVEVRSIAANNGRQGDEAAVRVGLGGHRGGGG